MARINKIQDLIDMDICPECGGDICRASLMKSITVGVSNPSRSLILSMFKSSYKRELNHNDRIKCCENCTWCERG